MKKVLGIILIIFGIIGGLLPVIPGFVFFFLGIALISPKLEKKLKKIHTNYMEHHSIKKVISELYILCISLISFKRPTC